MTRADGRPHHGGVTSVASRLTSALFAVMLVIGLGLIGYPTASDWWNRAHQSHAVAAYASTVSQLEPARRKAMLEQARAYNARLAASADRWHPTVEETRTYESLLDVTGTGIMGYVTIPRLGARFPIYHGTDEAVLQVAIGHLPGSSLPVGGDATHAAVAGHTGLPSARLLTGLDALEEGDTFAFHVLGETLTYQVDRISVVLPDELDGLAIEDGADLATLITCTPYGVNSHRLLVRGHRIATPAGADDTDHDTVPSPAIIATVAMAVTAAGITVPIISRRTAQPRGRHRGGGAGAGAPPDDSTNRSRNEHDRIHHETGRTDALHPRLTVTAAGDAGPGGGPAAGPHRRLVAGRRHRR